MAQRTAVTSTRALYKYLLRETEKLPSNAKIFYRNSIKRVIKKNGVTIRLSSPELRNNHY